MAFLRACRAFLPLLATIYFATTAAGETVLLDFYSDNCGPCRMMSPLVDQLANAGFPVQKVNLDQNPQLAQQFGVQSIPCFVMIANGREVDRQVGATTVSRLEQMFARAQQSIQFAQRDESSLRRRNENGSPGVRIPGYDPGGPLDNNRGTTPPPMDPRGQAGLPPSSSNADSPLVQKGPGSDAWDLPSDVTETPSNNPLADRQSIKDRAMAASVRLKVEDPYGFNYGSGTVIDVHGEEALVLTCAHIFRTSRGQGQISVDVFAPNGNKTVSGTLIACNLDRDVALVAIRPGMQVPAMRVAPPSAQLRPVERLFAIGCSRGMEPELVETRLVREGGSPGNTTFEANGRPVDGRSGGGLFTTDGWVVGVCNGAFQNEDKGLYSGLSMIQAELDHANLGFLFRTEPEQAIAGSNAGEAQRSGVQQFQGMQQAPSGSEPATMRLDVTEQSLIQAYRQSNEKDDGVVFIVHPNGQGSGQRIQVIKRPSSTLLDQLAHEFEMQQAGQSYLAQESAGAR